MKTLSDAKEGDLVSRAVMNIRTDMIVLSNNGIKKNKYGDIYTEYTVKLVDNKENRQCHNMNRTYTISDMYLYYTADLDRLAEIKAKNKSNMIYLKDLKEGDSAWVVAYGISITKAKVKKNEHREDETFSYLTLDYCDDTEFRYSGTATRGYEYGDCDVCAFSDKEDVLEYLKNGIREAERNLEAKQSLLEEFNEDEE